MTELGQRTAFSIQLEKLMGELNLSRVALARELGLDKSVIGRWLSGVNQPTGHNLTRITEIARRRWPDATVAFWQQGEAARGTSPAPAPEPAAPASLFQQGRWRFENARVARVPTLELAYVGWWSGFFQSVRNRNIVSIVSFHLWVDDLGLRCEFTEGRFWGDGPTIAVSSRLHCYWEMAPAYDRVCAMLFNGVFGRDTLMMDGLVLSAASDPVGTPASSPMLLFRIGSQADYERLGGLEGVRDRVAAINVAHQPTSEDTREPMRAIAPDAILDLVWPRIGDARADGEIDYVLRAPAPRAQAAMLAADPKGMAAAAVVRKLRRLFELE